MNTEDKAKHSHFAFLKSALCVTGSKIQIEQLIDWLREQNDAVKLKVEKVKFSDLQQWDFDAITGSLRHETGRFFAIDGIKTRTNWGKVREWDQPIINQPEVGYLGLIAKEIDGILHFLMQAKIEPGNVNFVQLAPTLQATRSNYSQVHKGKKPPYLEYFQKADSSQILLDQLQSEQGARFLRKRNRNIIIKVDNDIHVYENFIWLTLGQIKSMMHYDNLVNMDSRTVISGISYGSFNAMTVDLFNYLGKEQASKNLKKDFLKSALRSDGAINTLEQIITFLTQLKSDYDLEVTKVPLNELSGWEITESEIHHQENKYFKVIAVDVEIGNREVVKWNQPMVEPAQEGLCAFVCREIGGLLHFAVQAKLECGNHDIIEFAPTVQCLTGNYRYAREGSLPFLDYVLNAPAGNIFFDTRQSEEGGRFFREQNRNMIVIAGDEVSVELPDNYIWITLNQLYAFLKFNNYLNIQARSLIAAITFA